MRLSSEVAAALKRLMNDDCWKRGPFAYEERRADVVRLRTALEAAPDPEEVALMRAVCEAALQVDKTACDIGLFTHVGTDVADALYDTLLALAAWKELTEHE
jgi:hypothetical protein